MTDIAKLIADLEKAEEGSRELDARIWADTVCTPADFRKYTFSEGCMFEYEPDAIGDVRFWVTSPGGDRQPHGIYPSPEFSTSIDAALTLVPEHMIWKMFNDFPGDVFWAIVTDFDDGEFTEHRSHACPTPTPALALCIAALKARDSLRAREAAGNEEPE